MQRSNRLSVWLSNTYDLGTPCLLVRLPVEDRRMMPSPDPLSPLPALFGRDGERVRMGLEEAREKGLLENHYCLGSYDHDELKAIRDAINEYLDKNEGWSW